MTNLRLSKTSSLTVDRVGMETWLDVLTGPVRYRANSSWSPAAAVGVTALIVSVQLALHELSPELDKVISGSPQSGPRSGLTVT